MIIRGVPEKNRCLHRQRAERGKKRLKRMKSAAKAEFSVSDGRKI